MAQRVDWRSFTISNLFAFQTESELRHSSLPAEMLSSRRGRGKLRRAQACPPPSAHLCWTSPAASPWIRNSSIYRKSIAQLRLRLFQFELLKFIFIRICQFVATPATLTCAGRSRSSRLEAFGSQQETFQSLGDRAAWRHKPAATQMIQHDN